MADRLTQLDWPDWWPWWWPRRQQPYVSLIVPYNPDPVDPTRRNLWRWLRRYWEYQLPEAEIVVGRNDDIPFSKARAVNNAAYRASGDVYVIVDADVYYLAENVRQVAQRIRDAVALEQRLWFVPFRHVYRLTYDATRMVLQSEPYNPLVIPSPPPAPWVESMEGSTDGHRYGAMIQIMPMEAFWLVGGMDERFAAWGGEDVSLVRALDTLYSPHKTVDVDVNHLWHPSIGTSFRDKQWAGQHGINVNARLTSRFNVATGDVERMRSLVDEQRPRRGYRRKGQS